MEDRFLVQAHKNKNNNQISLTILKRKTSDKILDMIKNNDTKFIELKLYKFIK